MKGKLYLYLENFNYKTFLTPLSVSREVGCEAFMEKRINCRNTEICLLRSLMFLMYLSLHLVAQAQSNTALVNQLICFTKLDELKIEATLSSAMPQATSFYVSLTDDKTGEEVFSKTLQPLQYNGGKAVFKINNLKLKSWSPANPQLYRLYFFINGNKEAAKKIGFRTVESKNGNVYLNGNPVFLRGIAINPPDRGIPDSVEKSRRFATEYVSFMKSINVNIIRIPNDDTWYDVCDELGMMVFGGNYGGSVDGQRNAPTDYDKAVKWYKDVAFATIASHPSLMIYAMTNEVAYEGKRGEAWNTFLSYAHGKLTQWDDTRLYIGNAGYGYGKAGDICDLHRYWGWYYNTPFNFINIRDNKKIIPFDKKMQPVTFTECVGNYTGPTGAYNLTPNHKNPGSQLNWAGHADWKEQPRLADEHQSFTLQMATEMFRRLRPQNKELSGVFPFTIIFYNWNNIRQFSDMEPKPVTKQISTSYNPILTSWECWTPNVYAGNTISPIVHMVNDNNDFSNLQNATFIYTLQSNNGIPVVKDSLQLPEIKYYDTWQKKLCIRIPATIPRGSYFLTGKVIASGKEISNNRYEIFVDKKITADKSFSQSKNILLFDASAATRAAMDKLRVPYQLITSFNALQQRHIVMIAENSAAAINAQQASALKKFIAGGGKVICLRQDEKNFAVLNNFLNAPLKNITVDLDVPYYTPPPRPSRQGIYINPERPAHPVFADVIRKQLRVWSDYTDWDETKPGFPAVYPVTDGFIPANKEDIQSIAVLGNYGVGLEGIAIAEIFNGKGSVLVCGTDWASRAGIDPVADRLLLNMLRYMSDNQQHEKYPLVTAPIVWGDYASEKGILTGVNSGLMVHSVPKVPDNSRSKITVTEIGDRFLGAPGGFNTRPGVQYLAHGRRMFGPYILRGFGNVPEPVSPNNNVGEGYFWCRVPAGKTICSTLVWNQADEPLKVEVEINTNYKAEKLIPANAKATVDCSFSGTELKVFYKGDRRLVLLETNFK